jgi:DNA-binding transcriptional LysR family regulator
LELRNLRAFLAIVEHGHFGHAAASLNLTQPALTQRIQVLEREVGQQLLTRDAREVRLTPAGAVLLDHAKALVQTEDRALREMKDYLAGISGRLRISYLTLWDGELPTTILAEFRRRHPGIKLEMSSGYSQQNLDRLLNGDVDFAFVGAAIGPGARIDIQPLDRHEIVLVMSPAHHLAQMEAVPMDRLRGEPMVGVSLGVNPPLVAALTAWLTKATGEAPNIIRAEPPDQMSHAVAESESAVALMSVRRATLAQGDGLVFRPLVPVPLIEYGFGYARDNRSPALANLLATIADVAPPLPRDLPEGRELVFNRQNADPDSGAI